MGVKARQAFETGRMLAIQQVIIRPSGCRPAERQFKWGGQRPWAIQLAK